VCVITAVRLQKRNETKINLVFRKKATRMFLGQSHAYFRIKILTDRGWEVDCFPEPTKGLPVVAVNGIQAGKIGNDW